MLKGVSSPGSATKASARGSAHRADTPAGNPVSVLCTVIRSTSERKRSKRDSAGRGPPRPPRRTKDEKKDREGGVADGWFGVDWGISD
jgi:hypothetical protein